MGKENFWSFKAKTFECVAGARKAGICKTSDVLKNETLTIAEEILKITSLSHDVVQNKIDLILKSKGFTVIKEFEIRTYRRGFIDVVARKDGIVVGVEIDGSIPRRKSIEKLNILHPDVAFIVLRRKISKQRKLEISERVNKLACPNFIVIDLCDKRIIIRNLKTNILPKEIKVSFKEAQGIVNFKILSGNYIAKERGWGRSLYHRELEIESETHKKLKELSVRHFQKLGYRTNQMSVGVKGERTISDYFMVKDGIFYFVECLTDKTIRSDPKIIERKLKLSKYAPMWFVLERTTNLGLFPKRDNIKFLLVDMRKGKCSIPREREGSNLVWQLGESDDPSAIPKLIEFTKSGNANERRLAASGLGKLARYKPQIYKACPHLIKLLKDEKPQVRQYAAKALGKIGYVKALPNLRELLNDKKIYVRKAAEIAIKNCELEYEKYKRREEGIPC